MKPTVERISNLVKSLQSFDLKEVRNKAVSNGWEMEYQEYALDDAIGDLIYILDLVIESIKSNSINRISAARRNQFISNLDNINSILPNIITNNENQISTFIQEVDRLKDETRVTNLDIETKKFPSYATKRQELNNLIKKYTELVSSLNSATEIKSSLESLSAEVIKIRDDSVSKQGEIANIQTNLSSVNEELINKNALLEANFNKANQYITDINTIKSEIEQFHGLIDSKTLELNSTTDQSQKIISKHNELQTQITDLLAKATANNLFQAFGTRADKLQERIWKWVIGIVLSIIAIGGLGIWIAVGFHNDGVDGWFIFKLFITAPFVYSLLFFSRQFGNDRKLQEEYAYKSTISLSLPAYREELQKISEQEDGRKENIAIMERTMQQIFTSPTENLSKNPVPESETVVDLYKMIETVIKSIKS